MQQYVKIKEQYPDCVLFFRMGDFYEMFFDDAKLAARELEITLTKRGGVGREVPLAGIPYRTLNQYLPKLLRKNYKVVIVEQMEDPKLAKGLVKRDIVRVITPGTDFLGVDDNEHSFICAVSVEKGGYGLARADLTTGLFEVSGFREFASLLDELKRINPREIIVNRDLNLEGYYINKVEDKYFFREFAESMLRQHFSAYAGSIGVTEPECIAAAGGLLRYLYDTQKAAISQITKITSYSTADYMELDAGTIRNLELFRNIADKTNNMTLLHVIDSTSTPMGARMLRQWMSKPLLEPEQINMRLDAVGELMANTITRLDLFKLLAGVYDIERLIARVASGNASPRDLCSLRTSLEKLPNIKAHLNSLSSKLLVSLACFELFDDIVKLLDGAIKDDPAAVVSDGDVIRDGYSPELDELRGIARNSKAYISGLEKKEKDRTGIKSLKLGYNRVIGYYIEVTKPNLQLVPQDYMRKQSQLNSERFVTEELKEKEALIVGAEEKATELEKELFSQVISGVSSQIAAMQDAAGKIARLDVLLGFADSGLKNSYVRPAIDTGDSLEIKDGRHPVIEKTSTFIPNDLSIGHSNRLMIITGPNMAGKSVYMRQNALIIIMAQIGCFVPASYAKIGIVDKIFTRVGAFDDVTLGQSTFMVEMLEVAHIANNATRKSFVILDEIGRGTSTFDGVSIAWAVAEYLFKSVCAKTLFATHYHVLNELANELDGVQNYNIAVKENKGDIIFLRKIVRGGTDKSYGIHVAKLAGLPDAVVERSKEIQARLASQDEMKKKISLDKVHSEQMKLYEIREGKQDENKETDTGDYQ